MKTDHKGFVLPAGMRFIHTMRDYQEHRKITFYQKLFKQNWSHVNYGSDLEAAVNFSALYNRKINA